MKSLLHPVVLKIENDNFMFNINTKFLSYEPDFKQIFLFESYCQTILRSGYIHNITGHFGNTIEQMTKLKYNGNIKF